MSTWSEIYTIKFPTSSSSPAISTITPSRPASLLRIIVVALATGPSGHTAFTLDALVPSTATLQQNGTVVPRADFANGWANLPGTSREFYGVQEGGVTCVSGTSGVTTWLTSERANVTVSGCFDSDFAVDWLDMTWK